MALQLIFVARSLELFKNKTRDNGSLLSHSRGRKTKFKKSKYDNIVSSCG